MPSFDAGYYQLTSLIPLRQDLGSREQWDWKARQSSDTFLRRSGSVADSLRELLGSFHSVDVPDVSKASAAKGLVARSIPFSGNDRTHFARLVVVDHLAYNGRQQGDSIIDLVRRFLGPWLPGALRRKEFDEVDHLPTPYLLVLLDFDSPDGSRESVESYLLELWALMQQEWTAILNHCSGFEQLEERRVDSYLDLILRHEIETTFGYAIYSWGAERAQRWQPALGGFRSGRGFNRPGLLFGFVGIPVLEFYLALVVIGVVGPSVLVNPCFWIVALFALVMKPFVWQQFLKRANEPWPHQAGSDLRSVLKALFLQQSLLRLLESCQEQSSADDSLSRLAQFRQFLQETRPHDLRGPTLKPGCVHRSLKHSPTRHSLWS